MTDSDSRHEYSVLPNGQVIHVYEQDKAEPPPPRSMWPGVIVTCFLAIAFAATCLGSIWIARN